MVYEHVHESAQDKENPVRYIERNDVVVRFDDAWAEPNIQHKACWYNTLDCRADPTPHLFSASCVCSRCHLIPPKKPSKFTPAHDAVAAALSYKHHPTIYVGAGSMQLVYGSPSMLVTDAARHRTIFSPFFSCAFLLSHCTHAHPRIHTHTRKCTRLSILRKGTSSECQHAISGVWTPLKPKTCPNVRPEFGN